MTYSCRWAQATQSRAPWRRGNGHRTEFMGRSTGASVLEACCNVPFSVPHLSFLHGNLSQGPLNLCQPSRSRRDRGECSHGSSGKALLQRQITASHSTLSGHNVGTGCRRPCSGRKRRGRRRRWPSGSPIHAEGHCGSFGWDSVLMLSPSARV